MQKSKLLFHPVCQMMTLHVTKSFCIILQFALVHYFTKVGAGEYYLEELEETICEKEMRKLAMYEEAKKYADMCGNMNGIVPVNGATKVENNISNNMNKENSSTDKSDNEKAVKTQNHLLSVRVGEYYISNSFEYFKTKSLL